MKEKNNVQSGDDLIATKIVDGDGGWQMKEKKWLNIMMIIAFFALFGS